VDGRAPSQSSRDPPWDLDEALIPSETQFSHLQSGSAITFRIVFVGCGGNEAGSHYVVQLAWSSPSSCLGLPSAGIMCHIQDSSEER
jgi:hypothetical protein